MFKSAVRILPVIFLFSLFFSDNVQAVNFSRIQHLMNKRLTYQLRSKTPAVREKAAYTLGKMGTGGRMAIPYLKHLLLNDPMARVRATAAKSLGQLGKNSLSFVALQRALFKDQDASVRLAAAIAFGDWAPSAKSIKILKRAMRQDPDKRVQVGAAHALGKLAPGNAKAPIKNTPHAPLTLRQNP